MAEDRVYIGDFTRKEFRERMEAGVIKACIVPVSSAPHSGGRVVGGGVWRLRTPVAWPTQRRLARPGSGWDGVGAVGDPPITTPRVWVGC